MEGAINQLELLFNRTEADLSYISRKLETEFASEYESISAQKLNPLTALARIEELRAEIASLAARSADLEIRKATVTDALKSRCLNVSNGVAQLETLGSSGASSVADGGEILASADSRDDMLFCMNTSTASSLPLTVQIPATPHSS
jgi:hypothetical protein